MADDEIDVLIEDEPVVVDPDAIGHPVLPKPAEAKPAAVTKPEDGIAVLQKQLADSKAESAANAARAAQADQAAVAAKTEAHQTNQQLVENAIASAKQVIEATEVQIADAYASQDFTTVAKLQTVIARKAAEQLTLENGLAQMKAAPKPQPTQTLDPVEAFASSLTAPAAAWIRSRPEYVRDPRLNAQLIAAHNLAVARGSRLDSPEYFAQVEASLGITGAVAQAATDTGALSDTALAAGGRGSTTTAPPAIPARNGGPAPRTVRLTADQVEAAAASGMTTQEYARELERLKAEGRIGTIQ